MLWDHLLLSTDLYPTTLLSDALTVAVYDDNSLRGDTLIGRATTSTLKRCIMQGNVGKEIEIKMDLTATDKKGVEVDTTHSFTHLLTHLLCHLLTHSLTHSSTHLLRILLVACCSMPRWNTSLSTTEAHLNYLLRSEPHQVC